MNINVTKIKGVIAKYWLKLYSDDNYAFSKEMNDKLEMMCGNFYTVYIRLLYFALKKGFLPRFEHKTDIILSFTVNSKETNYKEYKIEQDIKDDERILYCRSFLLFKIEKDDQNNEIVIETDTNKGKDKQNNNDKKLLKLKMRKIYYVMVLI